ncbi:4Fe-4S dicluster domain-containing protein [Clostridium butyricum]|uniref:Iron-sulfur cluster-binding protein n=1 Tax=Clostridium butyricum E4 str. BoNT E BL5262 TaxID=632245 RepID=C4IIF9_CLOBU|nr:4Fe-4S dicluster-binding protein [Clostridium butyricum]EDT73577.1 iron-sulfur cluster-binding protein [Clostridium butyricum 5521]EEP53433.1 iron-sulfur cluster-binding protein [Clostridium butyricum E4 str. BoNT E BL5262]NFL31067.1 4Fe-4S dicluster domain-containing protein [Clostridium butyricum]NFS19784.1 4Fe-4S dicluster domain-containing protein [Clostridium butyricum]
MSHLVGKDAYKSLEERLNKFPQGAPPSETLYKILSMMFTEREAELVAKLPIKAFNIKTAALIWNVKESEAQNILDTLASKALILDLECDKDNEKKYLMAPPMAGFFEFALMRTGGHLDQKVLSQLFHQYLNVEDDFMKELFYGSETKMGRAFVQERVLNNDNSIDILDYEKASHIIKSAKHIGVSSCYCRHKAHHLGNDCYAPMETCLSFDTTAYTLTKHNYARKIDSHEALDILNMCYDYNLVQCGENVQKQPNFMCNCCKCHCEAFTSAKKFGLLVPVNTTSYIPYVDTHKCIGCGKCTNICPMEAIGVTTIGKDKYAKVDDKLCLGCGVCVKNCPKDAIKLKRRKESIITPVTTVHRVVITAIEKGQLQNLIFDNQAHKSHKAMAAILASILKLSPVHKVMASKQMKSVYLAKLLENS